MDPSEKEQTTEERIPSGVSSTNASQTRRRKKSKWDQAADAESLLKMPSLVGISVLQPKIAQQDELVIAREIVINDAESSLRYKLTKRQTQEEIQKCTGAVVITRGKYRPPNTPLDCEKPLYLHISAAAHLKETAERIIAVDRAATMVEEMLKQGQSTHSSFPPLQTVTSNGVKAMSTCVYLGFDADPSLDIATRIRGPNDQYINHIMNETGVTVMLKGCGSGSFEPQGEVQQPLHLFLSSSNPKSLEDAKRLAENLLDTISIECGASSRAPSCKVYNAVPPPQRLLTSVQSFGNEHKVNAHLAAGLTSMVSITPAPPVPSVTAAGVGAVYSQAALTQSGGTLNCAQPQPNTQAALTQSGGTLNCAQPQPNTQAALTQSGGTLNCVQPQPNMAGYAQPILSGGTSYCGYEGIYPQATPLQQVALALRQSTSPITAVVAPTTSVASTATKSNVSYASEKEKRPPQKRKFQELPVGSKGPSKFSQVLQGSELPKPSKSLTDVDVRNVSNMPAPKKLVPTLSKEGMPPPPPRSLLPLPPSKFTSSPPTTNSLDKKNGLDKTKSDNVPDTLVQLMEYGDDEEEEEEEDDPKETSEESLSSDSSFSVNSSKVAVRKPFWAL